MPSSQTIYGIVVMLTLNVGVSVENAPGIFAIGLLGLTYLQISGLRSNQTSLMRTQATAEAYNMADRLRANPVAAVPVPADTPALATTTLLSRLARPPSP